VRPQTSEELWKNTKIHKNTLVSRLGSLIDRNMIIKHRYTLPYNKRNFGGMFDLRYKTVAQINRVYYLLNWANDEARNLVNSYFESKKSFESEVEYDIFLIPMSDMLSKSPSYKKLAKGETIFSKLSYSEKREYLIASIKLTMECHKRRLGLDLLLVKDRSVFTRNYKEYNVENIRTIIKYLSKSSPSIFDVIIRMMTDPIVYGMEEKGLPSENFGYLYKDVWETVENEGRVSSLVLR
jgi:hypothetical protein